VNVEQAKHFQLRCLECGMLQEELPSYRCAKCGGELGVCYDLRRVKARWNGAFPALGTGLSRFRDLLPSTLDDELSLGEGNTPLVSSRYYAQRFGLPHLYFKCEHLNPSGSFKDREISVAVATALMYGKKGAVISSSGNAGAALATYAARTGLYALVLVPNETPRAKLAQIARHGALLWAVEGASISAERYLARAAAVRHIAQWQDWVPMITARSVNPFAIEGVKTISYEIVNQLAGEPDWVVVPIGGGGLLGGMFKGMAELQTLGLISRLPRILGVQTRGCSTVARAFRTGDPITPVRPHTKVTGIGAPIPYDADWALACLHQSQGAVSEVSDEEVFAAAADLARNEGIFVEPAGAASVAALQHAVERGVIRKTDKVVCCLTGTAFKDMELLADASHDARILEVDAGRLNESDYVQMKIEEGFALCTKGQR
jgi:threonine synthase